MPTELIEAPNLSALYLKAAASGPTRSGSELPDTEYVRYGVPIDRNHLADFNEVCGFGLRDELPVTYPHMLSFGMSVRLMTDPGFPFALVGLVHVANTITRTRPLLVTDEPDLRVRVENLRPHPKGKQFDVVTEATVGADEVVWRETSTYLRRGKSDESVERAQTAPELEAGHPTGVWRAPGDLGRRYAAVSGDRNPIHLNALAAKAFGFPRTIAHGMWSKARCLAAFEGRMPGACSVSVDFRKPVLLPSTVEFTERSGTAGADFALHSRSGKPHLFGTIR
ncbi:MaoC family dehydratase [Parasphingorhabdus pacifica]